EKVKEKYIEDIKELFNSFEKYYKNIENNLALETEIANLAKMQIGMKLNDKLNNINISLSKIKRHRDDIDFIIKELKKVCMEMDSLIVKAIPNFKPKKADNKKLNVNSINAKNKSCSSINESALSKGIEYNKLCRYNDAIIELERLIPAYSKSFNLWYQLGIAYSNMNNYKKTIEVLSKAIEIYPKDHDSWRILAWAYSENGQYKESLFAFNKASNLSM
ncbi:tetratricopeptide repeat protein, partial [uncultured Brachyspira sp.]|uniref:tetratricopeptide repeat protein n=1 Tax=uncultured Brachyspira sp. TaxID=221953 RepID=UPI00262D9DC1